LFQGVGKPQEDNIGMVIADENLGISNEIF
jgi:hypothetical protein